ncbi:hypothetical protein GCM10020218_105910 [Dactylosporangium vinaceum]
MTTSAGAGLWADVTVQYSSRTVSMDTARSCGSVRTFNRSRMRSPADRERTLAALASTLDGLGGARPSSTAGAIWSWPAGRKWRPGPTIDGMYVIK